MYGCDTIITDDDDDNTNYNLGKKMMVHLVDQYSYRRLEGSVWSFQIPGTI